MEKETKLIIATALIIMGFVTYYIFSPDYPCFQTECGCSSYYNYILDSWAAYVFFIMCIIGFVIILGCIGNEK